LGRELFDHQLVGRGEGLGAGHQSIQVVVAVELVGTERVSAVGYGCVGRGGLLSLLARYRSLHHTHG
jgi:hypothetical protein